MLKRVKTPCFNPLHHLAFLLMVSWLLAACTPAWQQPVSAKDLDYTSEIKTLSKSGVTVTVLSLIHI